MGMTPEMTEKTTSARKGKREGTRFQTFSLEGKRETPAGSPGVGKREGVAVEGRGRGVGLSFFSKRRKKKKGGTGIAEVVVPELGLSPAKKKRRVERGKSDDPCLPFRGREKKGMNGICPSAA